MARARNLKPGFFKNEDLAECSFEARLCFAGLWTLADREGRLEDRPKRIKGELFAFDSIDVEPLLAELVRFRFIVRYEAAGRRLIQVLKFSDHQNPHHREPESELPPPPSPGLTPACKTQKPEADAGSDRVKASGKPRASPGLAPPSSDLARGSSRAESGIDESGTLIPDSGTLIPASSPPAAAHTREGAREAGQPMTRQGEVCRALRQAGIASVNSSHPRLLALLDAGATVPEFLDAAAKAEGKRDAFAYVLGVVEGRRTDAVKTANGVHRGALPTSNDRVGQQLESAGLMVGGALRNGRNSTPPTAEVIDDVKPRLLAP